MSDTYNLPINKEALKAIVIAVLKEDMDSLYVDMDRVHSSTTGKVFSLDKDRDIDQIAKHLDAYKLLIKYYGGSVE
jgi:hypothetical protein